MARPAHIQTQDIVTVARELFLQRGTALSTAAIAQHLGISEGSIYRRFPTKAALVRQAMGLPDLTFCAKWEQLASEGEVGTNLAQICRATMSHLREVIPRLQALQYCAESEIHRSVDTVPTSSPVRVRAALKRYLDAEVRAHRLDAMDTDVAARMVLGMLAHFVFLEHLGLEQADSEPLIERTVDFLLKGRAA